MSVRPLGQETYTHFFYWTTHPDMLQEVIHRINEKVKTNLFAAGDSRFTRETIDLNEHFEVKEGICDLHCKGNTIYCRDSQSIIVLKSFDKYDIQIIPIGDASAMRVQNGMACIVRDQAIEVIDLNSQDMPTALKGPDFVQVRSTCQTGGPKEFDIHVSDSHLAVGYLSNPPGHHQCNAQVIVWNHRTKERLNKIRPSAENGRSAIGAPGHFTTDTFYSVYTSWGTSYIDKWDLHNFNTSSSVDLKESTYSLNTYKEFLLVGKLRYLSVYNASDLTFTHNIKNHTKMIASVKNPLSFGNSILYSQEGFYQNRRHIEAVKITEGILEKTAQLVLENEMLDSEAQICTFNPLGIGKLVVATVDGKIHILDFLPKK